MRIRLSIAGGVATPITSRQYVVDAASLPAPMATELEKLVASARSEAPSPANPRLRDGMSYELTISHDGADQTLSADDGAVPPGLRALIEFVRSNATSPAGRSRTMDRDPRPLSDG